MERRYRLALYFGSWFFLFILSTVLNFLNVDWSKTHIVTGILVVILLSLLQGSVFEFPIQTVFCLAFGGHVRDNASGDGRNLKLIFNYNLLAESKDDITECMENMFDAYMGNLRSNVAAVLVSATKDEELKHYEHFVRENYRFLIFNQLFHEGLAYSNGEYENVDSLRKENIWDNYKTTDMNHFRDSQLYRLCHNFSDNFMVIHRTSKVLRKCGQYQDLMLLSEGNTEAYTYCDSEFYSSAARKYGEPLFQDSEDVKRIMGKKFDFTLVLDSDNKVSKGTAFKLLDIAAANPERGIIQPGILLECNKTDTLFMHLESMRQAVYEPMTNALAAVLEQSSFFGKGLVNNKLYIDKILGTKENLIERVPIDVISHDTFEASIMQPLYVGGVQLTEAPSYNYVTWNIRERRWNKGEILLAMYFFPNIIGKPMRFLQRKFQKSFVKTRLRTVSKLDFVSSYVAHSALRQMFMKPILLTLILVHLFAALVYSFIPISVVLFLVLIFPKLATCNRNNYKYVVVETLASVVQFTPEAVVGAVRIFRAFQAIITNNTHWVPQKVVEMEFKILNPFISSFRHLWGYSLFSVTMVTAVFVFVGQRYFFLFMMTTVCFLPVFTAITTRPSWFSVSYRKKSSNMPNLSVTTNSLSVTATSIRSSLSSLIPNSLESYSAKKRIRVFQTKFHSLSPKDLLVDLTQTSSMA